MTDDFFSSVPLSQSSPDGDGHGDFAHAISLRFGATDLRTARLLPDDLPTLPHPSSQVPVELLTQPRPAPPPPSRQTSSIPPSALSRYLADPRTLILDIRPHAAHAAARVNNALSLSVPTTLLKRPLFSLSKLSQMLPTPSSRTRFADWSSASCILVYDSDSTCSPDNGIIAGLLRKFRAEGFTGELGWVHGGFQAVWKETPDLATTEPPSPEEDDHDAASSSGTLRTTHLPRAAFSLFSTTAAPSPQLGVIPGSNPPPNTSAPSVSRAANPFFDTIRQNVELSHGITERIPLRLPGRVRRRIHDLPSRWLQDIACRSALRRSSTSRHLGLDSLESGSESSDDPHISDPDENDPNVEEGTEALAMQFYRIELAEQRRLRSIMEHHTRESQMSGSAAAAKPRRTLDKDGGRVNVRTGAKSVPATPHPTIFPFSITAAVEKGTKNRYTHIWPFEHARVRLHDGRHQGSHLGRRDKSKASERSQNVRDRSGRKDGEREEQDKQHWSRLSPRFAKEQDQRVTEVAGPLSGHFLDFDARSPISRTSVGLDAGLAHPGPGPNVPQVKIEYDTTEQDFWMSGPSTPATALPLSTPPFYTPMEILPARTPMRSQPPQPCSFSPCISPGEGFGGAQVALPASSLPYFGPLPSFPLRLPNHQGGLLPSIGEQTWTSESLSPSDAPSGAFTSRGAMSHARPMHDPRREPSPVDDYVNASYVQPLCTRKRYIATQGPLPSTYVDFWTLVWEQNVHVIVMLTREVENAMVKCGLYWTDTEYGPLRLELLSVSPPMSLNANLMNTDSFKQGFFTIREPQGKASVTSRDQPPLITRTFLLTHSSYPGVPPRRITHLQYLDWSDMNVPDDPRGVLDLVNKVEQAVAESTPGPSPSRSGSQSPDGGPDQKGYDTLLSPTSVGVAPWEGRGRCRNEWRHPELDSRNGIAASALGKVAPVLLHCSAGVGRTGGFIAVDAVLDGIRRELRRKREEQRSQETSRVSVVVGLDSNVGLNDEASRELGEESTETGINYVENCGVEGNSGESERMDVDEPITDKARKTRNTLHGINTVPIHVSAGDRTKGRRRHSHNKDLSGEKQCSSSESLVVHVPYAGTNDLPEGTNIAGIDFGDSKEADWQSSTREWVERVSDQAHAHTEEEPLPLPPLLPLASRERSPGDTSNTSAAHISTDGSIGGSASANASGNVGSGRNENRVEWRSDTGSASGSGISSRSGGLPPSSVSNLGSGSISLSTSGFGSGAGSRFGSGLLRARLQDSSVTSISADSTDSHSPQRDSKSSASLYQPSVIHTSLSSNVEVECPRRPISVPLQSTYSSAVSFHHGVHSCHDRLALGPSRAARFSSPIPPGTAERGVSLFGGDAATVPGSQPSSDLDSNESASPPQEFESGESADAEGSNSRGVSDESEELAISSKSETNLRLDTEPSSQKALEILHKGSTALDPFLPDKGKERTLPLPPRALDGSPLQQPPTATVVPSAFEYNQRATDHPVIDYKLPRELHGNLSPPPISSFADPICTVIQDMREQRMSLCQSLRQYVFVHAAIIEGALRIVDEEREFWGYSRTSDDVSSAEGEPRTSVRKSGRQPGQSEQKALFRCENTHEAVATRLEPEHGSVHHRTLPLHNLTQPPSLCGPEGSTGGAQVSLAPSTSSSCTSSPSKGKRAPSPTELLKEDKTGALSLNKRPSIHRKKTSDGDDQFSFDSSTSSPVADQSEGGSRDAAVGMSGSRFALGRLVVPERDVLHLGT